jgi:hypothetical protein
MMRIIKLEAMQVNDSANFDTTNFENEINSKKEYIFVRKTTI